MIGMIGAIKGCCAWAGSTYAILSVVDTMAPYANAYSCVGTISNGALPCASKKCRGERTTTRKAPQERDRSQRIPALAAIRLSIIDLGGVLTKTHGWLILLHHLLAVSLCRLTQSRYLEDSRNLSILAETVPAVS